MTHNQKVAVFAAVIITSVVLLWGAKGFTFLLPGPSAK